MRTVLSHSSSYNLKRVSVSTRTRKSRRQPFANKTCVCVDKCRTCIYVVHNWIQIKIFFCFHSSKHFFCSFRRFLCLIAGKRYSFISKVPNRYINFFSGEIVQKICVFYTSRTHFQRSKINLSDRTAFARHSYV